MTQRKPYIGWIGTGVMGRWMCHHIMPLADHVYVYNRTKEKSEELLAEGAEFCCCPAEVAKHAQIIFTMVGVPEDVHEVYFGQQGIFSTLGEGKIVVDMTTTKPSLAMQIHQTAVQLGSDSIDAPVSGGDIGAKEARLSIMAGGSQEAYETLLPFFQAMGKTVALQGGPGKGQHTKMCNQIVIAGTMIGVCEALVYGRKADLDGATLVETIRKGAAGCWTLDNLAPRVLAQDYQPGFMIDHFVKDLGIAIEESKKMKISLPGLALAEQLYIALQGSGEGRLGTQALVLALDRLCALHRFSTS